MYFNVFFFFLLRHVYIRGDAVCRTRMVIHGERLARMRWSTVPFAKALIIKVNALLLRRGDDTHTWLKIDAADSFVEDFMENIFLLTLFFLLLRCFSCRRVRLRRKQKILLWSSEKFFCTTHFWSPEASYRPSKKFCHSCHNLISRANNCYLFFGSFLQFIYFWRHRQRAIFIWFLVFTSHVTRIFISLFIAS